MKTQAEEAAIHINIRSVVEFQRWWVFKRKFFKKILSMIDSSTKSAKIVLSKSILDVKNQQNLFHFFQ